MNRHRRDTPRRPGLARGVVACSLTAMATLACGLTAAPAQAERSDPADGQPLAALERGHVARAAPSLAARRLEFVAALRPLTRVRTVLPALGAPVRRGGRLWLHVRLPGRPSGHTGWILAAHSRATSTPWRVTIDLSDRRVTVFHYGRALRRFPAIVGKPSTPTPRGRFFVEEGLALSPLAAGGPYALATSARSSVLQEFEGGPGQIAIHGTANLSGTLGTAASHGCVRLGRGAVTWMSRRIGAGVPVTVSG